MSKFSYIQTQTKWSGDSATLQGRIKKADLDLRNGVDMQVDITKKIYIYSEFSKMFYLSLRNN